MRYLCVCRHGHCRSVAMTHPLHERGHDAVAAGYATCGTALILLSAWAEKILIAESHMLAYIPLRERPKVVSLDLGPDVWVNPYDKSLRAKIDKALAARGLP